LSGGNVGGNRYWEASYSVKLLARLEANVFPWLGDRPIRDMKPPELLSVLRRVESRGVLETAHRLMNYCGNIYRYAVATGRAERDISSDLRGALPPSTPRHHASVTDPEGVAALVRTIDGLEQWSFSSNRPDLRSSPGVLKK
jgi:integrase